MKEKIILVVMMLVLLSSPVYAALTDDLYFSIGCENDLDDELGTWNGNNTGVTFNSSVKKVGSYACDFNGVSSFFDMQDGSFPDGNFTLAMWWYLDNNGMFQTVFGENDDEWMYLGSPNGAPYDEIMIQTDNGGVEKSVNQNMLANTWYHIVMVHNDSATNKTAVYLNNTYVIGETLARHDVDAWDVGRRGAVPDKYWNGSLDEIHMWNRTLGTNEISAIYGNESVGIGYPWTGNTSNLTITASNYDDGVSIDNFSVDIVGPGYSESFNTTTGSIVTDIPSNDTNLYNITANSTQNGGYYNNTYFNYNVSSDLNVEIWQAIIEMSATEVITNNTLSGGTFSKGSSINTTTLFVSAGNLTISYSKAGYINTSQVFEVNALDNTTGTITNVYSSLINITARDILTSTQIENFTVNVSFDNGTYTYEESKNTTSEYVEFYLLNSSNYTFIVDAEGYGLSGETELFVNVSNYSYEFDLYTENSINFTFRDEQTGELINGTNNTIDIELISDAFSGNYSTTTGALYLDLLSPALYSIRYIADGYYERFYYLNLTDRSHSDLTLYLVNSSEADQVTATVYDSGNRVLEDVYIKVLRFDLDSNSYILREIAKTNFEGQTYLHLIQNDEFYKFMLEYPFGTLKKTTSPTYIYSTSLSFQISLTEDIAENFYNTFGVTSNISFNTATNNFKFTYTDNENSLENTTLKIYEKKATGDILVNTSTLSSTTGEILLNVDNTTGKTYEAKAYINFGDEDYYVESYSKAFEEESPFGALGLLVIIFVTILVAFTFIWSKTVALVMIPLPMLIGSILNIIDISVPICMALEIMCIIVAIVISKKG